VWFSDSCASRFRVLDKSSSERKPIRRVVKEFQDKGLLDIDETISGLYEEEGFGDDAQEVLRKLEDSSSLITLHSREMYEEIFKICQKLEYANVNTKYKTVAKKVKPIATQLPENCHETIEKAAEDPILRSKRQIGHKFTEKTLEQLQIGGVGFLNDAEKKKFEEMLRRHEKAFAFEAKEIGCVDPKVIPPMVIFTVPHVPWDLKPIPVPRAMIPKITEMLKEKIQMGILEQSMGPYSSRWFTVLKKSGALRFIQDMQPANKVTIRNMGSGPIVDEVAEAFAGRSIYSIGDLYSGYDQFQLALESRDLTTMRTPLGLMRMCTLPQGATNSVAHMQNAMNKILRDFIPEKTIPFVDDLPIKGCSMEEMDETILSNGCRKFVMDHIEDVEKILARLIEVNLTLSGEKSSFGVPEITVVGHLCGGYGRRPNPNKVDVIARIKDCKNITEVRSFLGACLFFRIWIPHYGHISEPLYLLLRKQTKFRWGKEQSKAMRVLKEILQSPPILRSLVYEDGRPIIITVDTSPIAIGWALGQDDNDGVRFASRFGARVLSERARRYSQVKRELWGLLVAMKAEKEYLIGAHVIVETDCLPLLGMISNCTTMDVVMLGWIATIKSLNPELKHIKGKDNVIADMLSRSRYYDEEEIEIKDDPREVSLFQVRLNTTLPFREDLYEGRLKNIGHYLSMLKVPTDWTEKFSKEIRHKAYGYLLEDGFLWKRPKRKDGVPLRVVDDQPTKRRIMEEFHDTLWAGHRGVWATYMKIKERYWWKGLYKDVEKFVGSCITCQVQSKIQHRDGLKPTYPLSIHFQWVIDLVAMPPGLWGMKYLVLAREELSNFVEGRALRTKDTPRVCRFILEDIVCRYGAIFRIRADRGELNAKEAKDFFKLYGILLKLTTAMNPAGNGKSERGHPPIVQALVKASKGNHSEWPRLLPFALWADRTTHSTVTGYMPSELMMGQKPIMPVEGEVPTWLSLPWKDDISREDLLALRIRQLERREEDIEAAFSRLRDARLKNKEVFDSTHRLRKNPIREGDWVLVYDSSLDNQHSTVRKFARRWFGPFVVLKVYDNATYGLRELDGTPLKVPIAGKRVKAFRRREGFLDLEEIFEREQDLVRPYDGDYEDATDLQDD